MKAFAWTISLLFHPLLMATYLYILFSYTMPIALEPIQAEVFDSFIMLIFLVTFLLPAVNIVIFKVFGHISSFAMPYRQERRIPFVFITLLYLLMTYLFYSKFRIDLTDNVFKFLLIIDLLVIGATVVTFFYRISVHSVAIAGLLGIIIPLNKTSADGSLFYPTIALIVIVGIVMSARLALQAHTLREVTMGGVLGYTISFVGMTFLF